MRQAGRKDDMLVLILLTPKETRIKDLDEIEKKMNSTFSTFANV